MYVNSARLLDAIVSGVLLAFLLGPAARADTVTTRFTTFMHAGPAKEFAVLDEIPSKSPLDLGACAGGWCRVGYGGGVGWVEQKMLAGSAPSAQSQSGARPTECFDFVRAGWPDAGDLDRLCIYPPGGGAPSPEPKKPGG